MKLVAVLRAVEVEPLPADHLQRRPHELARDVSGRIREREPKGLGEQRVAGEHRGRLAVGGPHRWRAAPLAVVVERRQVVVDERERVHELDGGGRGQRVLDVQPERVARRKAEHRPHALAAERVAHRLGQPAELGREAQLVEVLLDERAELFRPPRHPAPGRGGLGLRRPLRALQLGLDLLRELGQLLQDRRSPARGRPCARAASVPTRAARAGSRRSQGFFRGHAASSRWISTQDAVHEPRSVLGCIPLRERDRLVDRHLGRHLVGLELVDGDAKRAPLHHAEPVGRPPLGRGGDPRVELGRAPRDRLRDPPRPRVDLAGVLRADRLRRRDPTGRAGTAPGAGPGDARSASRGHRPQRLERRGRVLAAPERRRSRAPRARARGSSGCRRPRSRAAPARPGRSAAWRSVSHDDQLRDHRVVVRRDRRAGLDERVDADARPLRRRNTRDSPRRRDGNRRRDPRR